MTRMIVAWLDSLGIRNLRFGMSSPERTRLIWVSVIPALVLIAFIAELALGFIWDVPYDLSQPDERLRVYWIATSLTQYAPYLGLAILFFMSVAGVTRAMASYSIIASSGFLMLALVAQLIATIPYVFVDLNHNTIYVDVHIDIFQGAAVTFALLGAGYAFMAYSGLPLDEDEDAILGAESVMKLE